MGSESIAHETVTQLLRGENDSKQSDEIQARGIIIVLVKSNWLVKNIENKKILAS